MHVMDGGPAASVEHDRDVAHGSGETLILDWEAVCAQRGGCVG